MQDTPTVTFANILATIKGFAAMCAAITASAGFIGSIAWYVIHPQVAPYLAAIEQIPDILERVNTLELRVPMPKVLVFGDKPYVAGSPVLPGSQIRVQYFMQRTDSCATMVVARFYSYDLQGYDPRFTSEPRPSTRAPVTADIRPFSFILTVPEGMPSGNWAYAPEIIPGPDCVNQDLIYPPLADFRVRVALRQ